MTLQSRFHKVSNIPKSFSTPVIRLILEVEMSQVHSQKRPHHKSLAIYSRPQNRLTKDASSRKSNSPPTLQRNMGLNVCQFATLAERLAINRFQAASCLECHFKEERAVTEAASPQNKQIFRQTN
jgi:hypothetical protein